MSDHHLSIKTGLLFLIILLGSLAETPAKTLELYTPFTKISVPPGETVNYPIDIINHDSITRNCTIYVSGLSSKWEYSLRADGWNINEVAVLPGEKKTITLQVVVPFEINKGNYNFRIIAGNLTVMPLSINVSQKGTLRTEFTSDQVNMQGHTASTFTFRTQLKNFTGEKQSFALSSVVPQGWSVIFKPNYQQATSVEIEPNQSKEISIEVKPPHTIKAGKYTIPVSASTGSTSALLNLEVDITGNYSIELTTPTGLLSSSIIAGKQKKIDLTIRNSGSTDLHDIQVNSSKPQGWEVSFEPDSIPIIPAGEAMTIVATVKAYEKAIPGDYTIGFNAQTPETKSNISYRLSVKTSLLWGWLGITILLGTTGGIIFLFRKYGRR